MGGSVRQNTRLALGQLLPEQPKKGIEKKPASWLMERFDGLEAVSTKRFGQHVRLRGLRPCVPDLESRPLQVYLDLLNCQNAVQASLHDMRLKAMAQGTC